jgi:hypothetical protein
MPWIKLATATGSNAANTTRISPRRMVIGRKNAT